jgi:hypothetical protein
MRLKRKMQDSWKISLSIVLLLLGMGIAPGAWIITLRDRRWIELEGRVNELIGGLEAPPLQRIPLGRPLCPGNAWEDYRAAMAQMNAKAPTIAVTIPAYLAKRADKNRKEVEALVGKFSSSIELVRKAARRETALPPRVVRGQNGFQDVGRTAWETQDLASLCLGKARLLAEAGNCSESLDLLVDVCLYGRDLTGTRLNGGGSLGLTTMQRAFCEMRELLQYRNPSREDLEALDRSLSLLEEWFPVPTGDLHDHVLLLGDLLLREDRDDVTYLTFSGSERKRHLWRYGFSSRLQAAATFRTVDRLIARALDLRFQPWEVGGPASQSLFSEAEQSKDPLVSQCRFMLLGMQEELETKGGLRLLRMAAHYRASGKILDLRDPAGGQVEHQLSESMLLVWRRGVVGWDGPVPGKADTEYRLMRTIEVPRWR